MHAEYLVIHARTDGVLVEQVSEHLPQFNIKPAFALIIKPLDAVDGRTFMVPTQHEEVVGLLDLVGHEQADDFD